jgi:hypothetical protein
MRWIVLVGGLAFAACSGGADDGPNQGDDGGTTTCTCDTTTACDDGCLCDPECGGKALGSSCSCGGDADVCSQTECASSYCLWYGGTEGYCSQECGSCPNGFDCVSYVGLGEWCTKIETVPNCGGCSDSSDCQSFQLPSGVGVEAACFSGRCRMRCDASSPCDCVPGTPAGGNATGFCADDGC